MTSIGTPDGLTEVDDADLVKDGDTVAGVNGYESLNLGSFANNPDYDKQWKELQVPFNVEEGTYLRSKSVTQASIARPASSTTRNRTRWCHTDDRTGLPGRRGKGNFVNEESGERLQPGWQVNVGFANYTKLFTDARSATGSSRSRSGRSSSPSSPRSSTSPSG